MALLTFRDICLSIIWHCLISEDISVSPAPEQSSSGSLKLSPIDEEHKGLSKNVLRQSKGRKKDSDKERTRYTALHTCATSIS